MLSPNTYPLLVKELTVANASVAYTPVTGLEGASALTIHAYFGYGSGGTTCAAVVQTSFDDGTTWFDIARFDFTTATSSKMANLNFLNSKAIAAYTALSSEGVNDNIMGDRLRVVLISTGTYVNTTISVRVSAR
jgi:hypothetical protein